MRVKKQKDIFDRETSDLYSYASFGKTGSKKQAVWTQAPISLRLSTHFPKWLTDVIEVSVKVKVRNFNLESLK